MLSAAVHLLRNPSAGGQTALCQRGAAGRDRLSPRSPEQSKDALPDHGADLMLGQLRRAAIGETGGKPLDQSPIARFVAPSSNAPASELMQGRQSGRLGSARFCNNHGVTAGSIGCSALLFSRGP